ncbi:MAG: extracellular solute-binding protein [Anaerolineae bacterium]|nr:extracellular solute-binding protein [Anaerolineae bacterium]
MAELVFWVLSSDASNAVLETLLTEFRARTGIRVQLECIQWEAAWDEMVKIAIYRKGPDVSEIGSTWMGDLVGMHGIRPFTGLDLRALGSPQDFIPSLWKSAGLSGSGDIWGIPWMVDARLLFYRRDLLARADIDEAEAFVSFAALEETLSRLQQAGPELPWVIPTRRSWITLHNLAVWVWGYGGDFVSSDGKGLLFNTPEARAGFRDYFGLGRFMPPQAHHLAIIEADDCFSHGQAAVTLSGAWLWDNPHLTPELRANIGVTPPPGVPYVGGSHLVIWEHSRNVRDALKLIRFLTEARAMQRYAPEAGKLPARLSALSAASVPFHASLNSLVRGLVDSRSFHSVPLWGMIEDRLATTLRDIWSDVLESPETDSVAIIDRHLQALTRSLELAIRG